jgi:hypothetical protein
MTPSDDNPDAADRVAKLLQQAAETERAPESLRAAIRTQEREARERPSRPAAARSARKGLLGKGARRATVPVGPELSAAAAAEPLAPEPVVAERRESDGPSPARIRRRRQVRMRALAIPAVLVLIVLGTAVFRSNGHDGGPTIRQVAALSALSPADPAPTADPSAKAKLTTAVQGLHFPDWNSYGGWTATGARKDELQGRQVTTVFYRHGSDRIAYSIVAAPALTDLGNAARDHDSFHIHGRNYVIWTELDHTCMLSASTLSSQQLWDLAERTIL